MGSEPKMPGSRNCWCGLSLGLVLGYMVGLQSSWTSRCGLDTMQLSGLSVPDAVGPPAQAAALPSGGSAQSGLRQSAPGEPQWFQLSQGPKPRRYVGLVQEDMLWHMLVDPEHKIMACKVYKAGSTPLDEFMRVMWRDPDRLTFSKKTYKRSPAGCEWFRNMWKAYPVDMAPGREPPCDGLPPEPVTLHQFKPLDKNASELARQPGWTTAMFGRDPLDRFVSGCLEKCGQHLWGSPACPAAEEIRAYWGKKPWLSITDSSPEAVAARKKIIQVNLEFLEAKKARNPRWEYHTDPHFRPFSTYCGAGSGFRFDYLFMFQRNMTGVFEAVLREAGVPDRDALIQEYASMVPKLNHATSTDADPSNRLRTLLSPDIAARIVKLYEIEYSTFPQLRSTIPSWVQAALAAPPAPSAAPAAPAPPRGPTRPPKWFHLREGQGERPKVALKQDDILWHLLVDPDHKVMACKVYKAGSTPLDELMRVLWRDPDRLAISKKEFTRSPAGCEWFRSMWQKYPVDLAPGALPPCTGMPQEPVTLHQFKPIEKNASEQARRSDMTTFMIGRDPLDRFISGCLEKCGQHLLGSTSCPAKVPISEYRGKKPWLRNSDNSAAAVQERRKIIEMNLEFMEKKAKANKQWAYSTDAHFRPFSTYCGAGSGYRFDYLLLFERNMTSVFDVMLHKAKLPDANALIQEYASMVPKLDHATGTEDDPSARIRQLLSPEVARRVVKLYEQEYRTFPQLKSLIPSWVDASFLN